MTKYEFLNDLKTALYDNVSGQVISENMEYYESYIDGEIRNGKTEAQVMEMLGDPRLIARTIIDTSGSRNINSTYADESWEEPAGSEKKTGPFKKSKKTSGNKSEKKSFSEKMDHFFNSPKMLSARIVLIIALVLILILLLFIFFLTAVGYFIYVFWPVLLVLLLIVLITGGNRRV
ncbi:MAG: DUF1700 domain-containing protein [Lachnospiraceae bacterium]|nr:DUF1700 domain-containing protein [Lachnospiraceae bacterium]